ncbi:hypothetical protein NEUTE1DRAFT_99890 [Neurospora tetrasperma FGSC 2508]|uniref:Secreted protein n=1 Tax=Neurospora tetrasperma (strain FGSC 2508 / ATCC MYA-4615 / P0657) TaxID=510951 RepID=F8MI24_NEUT8|nr:uncharacterized protein NEUTE1DRAFT_99890 [Neurospora tetrasperma FGSC 2508]EGO59732.1 hypothetical protein NEUTE1DRAFT_99890 [Neurospora tetrasperma FGSC 2508]EGZ73874.1 hypothetical protein NEUTE2DRAFT_60122 [Neurospora tetrasperma FGSC 2509]
MNQSVHLLLQLAFMYIATSLGSDESGQHSNMTITHKWHNCAQEMNPTPCIYMNHDRLDPYMNHQKTAIFSCHIRGRQ